MTSPPTEPTEPAPPAARGVLARYAVAATLARVADGAAATALILLALERTGSAATGGLLAAATTLPHLAAAPVIGLLSDRVRSVRRFYVSAMVVFALALVGVTVSLGSLPLVVPLLGALVAGTVGPLLSGGMTSLLGGLVPAGALPRAFAIDSGTYSVAGIAGPGLVAAVAAVVGPDVALDLVAAFAGAAALAFCTIPAARRLGSGPASGPAHGPDSGPRQLVRGALVLWRVPALRASTLATTLSFVGTAGVLPLAVALFAQDLGQPTSAGGGLLSAFAFGALAGSLVLSARPLANRWATRTVYLSVLVTGLLLAAAAFSPSYALTVVLFAAAGVADTPMLTATFLIRNEHAPPGLRTQVFTTAAGLKIGSSAFGSAVAGAAAVPLGGTGLLLGAAAVQLVALGTGLLVSGDGGRREDRARPVDPAPRQRLGSSSRTPST